MTIDQFEFDHANRLLCDVRARLGRVRTGCLCTMRVQAENSAVPTPPRQGGPAPFALTFNGARFE